MESKNGNTNFWISYADLMAGLLFIFILLIGAIIVKYSLLQSESKVLETSLSKEKIALEKNKEELKNRLLENQKLKITLEEKKALIENQKKDISKKDIKLESFIYSNTELKEKLEYLDKEKKELLSNAEKLANISNEKDEKLNKLLEDLLLKEKLISSFQDKNELLNKNIKNIEQKLFITKDENTKLSNESKEYKEKVEQLTKASEEKETKLNKLIEELLVKKSLISSFENKNRLLDDEMKVMQEKLKGSKKEHERLSQDLQNTKQKIKSFTGIKIKVISSLKNKLGKNIQIDPKNGSLSLSSNILFDEGEFELKNSSKEALKVAVYDYFKTILENDDINKHIDKIVIEGHTNSKGNYLFNLELSQKRAYSVMDFLLSMDFKKKEKLQKLISASGRSFLDPIYNKNGEEDQDASRRIEIKLSLKNEDAIKEIANLLE